MGFSAGDIVPFTLARDIKTALRLADEWSE